MRLLLDRILIEKADSPELSVVARDDFDLAFPHAVHGNAHPFGRKAFQVLDRDFSEDFVFVSNFVDKFEIHFPNAFAFGCFG